MNQILVTKKLYVTPELKRKKKIYKFDFLISIFLVCILTSMYIYAEYDRNRGEAESKEILAGISALLSQEEDRSVKEDEMLVVVLDGDEDDYALLEANSKVSISEAIEQAEWESTAGYNYKKIGIISIPKIDLNYAIVQGETGSVEETDALLKRSPVKYHGCDPNEVGNFCIVAHNWHDSRFFGQVPNLVFGDTVDITDLTGRKITYQVYDKHTVEPDDLRDTTQMTGGKKEITLITCTNDSAQRVVVRCKEIK